MVKKGTQYDINPIGELLSDAEFLKILKQDHHLFNCVVCGDVSGAQNALTARSGETEISNHVALLAASRNQVQILRVLQSIVGVSLQDSEDAKKRNPLHYAAYSCHVDAVRFLLAEAGLDYAQEDQDGYSAFEYASTGGDVDVMDMILDCAQGRPPSPAPAPPPPMFRSMAQAPAAAMMVPDIADSTMFAAPPPMAPMAPMMRMQSAPMQAEAPMMAPEMASSTMEFAPPMAAPQMAGFAPSMVAPEMGFRVPMASMSSMQPESTEVELRRSKPNPLREKRSIDNAADEKEVPKKFFLQSLVLAARRGNTRAVIRLLDEAWLVREARAGLGSGRNSLLHFLGRRISAQELDKLASCGLDLASRNTSGVRAFEEVPPRVLQEFFDQRVKSSPPSDDPGVTESYTVDNPFLEHDSLDVSTLLELANSRVHSPLIFHPLFLGILAIKWRAVRTLYWLLALLALLFACATSWLTIARVRNTVLKQGSSRLTEIDDQVVFYSQIATCALFFILVVTEISNMLFHNLVVYVIRFLVAITCLIAVFLFIFLFPGNMLKQNAYFVIFIPWLLFMYHICQHYSFAQYYSNFIQICKTSLKIVLVFGSFPIAFALVFHVMLLGEEAPAYKYLHTAVIRTIAMMLGDMAMDEFEGHFTELQWAVTYTTFILGIALVLYNMVNALAVSDTQKLRNKADTFRVVALARQVESAQSWLQILAKFTTLSCFKVPSVARFTVECRNYCWIVNSFMRFKRNDAHEKVLIDGEDCVEIEQFEDDRIEYVSLSCSDRFVRELQAIAGTAPQSPIEMR